MFSKYIVGYPTSHCGTSSDSGAVRNRGWFDRRDEKLRRVGGPLGIRFYPDIRHKFLNRTHIERDGVVPYDTLGSTVRYLHIWFDGETVKLPPVVTDNPVVGSLLQGVKLKNYDAPNTGVG